MYPYLLQGNNIVVVIDNKSHTITKSHIGYERVKNAIKAGDWAVVKEVIDPVKVVLEYGNGRVAVKGDILYWDGVEMHDALSKRMIAMLLEGFPIEPMINFKANLENNPSFRAVNELYGFLEKAKLPITPDGCFLAYKRVRADFMDVYSGTVKNAPAYAFTEEERNAMPLKEQGRRKEVTIDIVNDVTVVSMPRNMVNDDKDQTCSDGLHFCSEGYLSSYGGETVLIVKVNPADVVSIPSDYKETKGRAWRYEIIGELGVSPEEAMTRAVQEAANAAAEAAADAAADGVE